MQEPPSRPGHRGLMHPAAGLRWRTRTSPVRGAGSGTGMVRNRAGWRQSPTRSVPFQHDVRTEGPMSQHPRAGQPAEPSDLVDLDALVRAYHDVRPDPSDPAQRVAFGTSGHRGSALEAAFNEAHILAT